MDLLKTVLLYMTMVFATSVENAPEVDMAALVPTPTPYVAATDTPAPTATAKPTPVPTIDITPNPEYKTIQMGDNGDRVMELQTRLAEYGYYTGEIDGRFGNQTRRAVESFQYQHGLSADGIAGRRTLTVLYESDQVRPAPQVSTTPDANAPTAIPGAVELTAAIASFTPVETSAPTETPAPTAAVEPSPEATAVATPAPTDAPTATPEPEFVAMEGYSIHVDGQEEVLEQSGAVLEPYALGDKTYLPLLEVLDSAAIRVIASSSLNLEELALVSGNDIIRLSYTEDQAGNPIDLRAYRSGEEQVLPGRDIRRVQDVLYVPAQCLESLLGFTVQADEATKTVQVTTAQQSTIAQ